MANYQESTGGTLPFYNDAFQNLLSMGSGALSAGLQSPAAQQQVAGLTPMHTQAFNLAQSSVGGYQPYIMQAGNTLANAGSAYSGLTSGVNPLLPGQQAAIAGAGGHQYGQATELINRSTGANLAGIGQPQYNQAAQLFTSGAQFDPDQLSKYLSPYLSGVVGEIGRLGQQQLSEQLLPTLSGQFSSLGQTGSARQAAMMADAATRSQRETLGTQANALHGGYQSAMDDYLNWARQQSAAAQGIQGIGAQQYAQGLGQAQIGLQGAQQLQGLGAQQAGQQLSASQLGQQAYQSAQDLALQQAQARAGTSIQSGSALGNLGQAGQQMYLSDIGLLSGLGEQQQTQRQKELDANYANQQARQQYPWQQLQQYGQLFGAGSAPQANTNWQTSFKKGGLARFADGGRFQENDLIEDQLQQLLAPRPMGANPYADQAMNMRQQFIGQLPTSPAFTPVPEPSMGEALGEAMMRASAQGPANLGQLIGRSGASYFDAEKERREKNRETALNRLLMEQRALPSISSGVQRSLSGPSPEQLRTVYTSARNEAAQIAKEYQFGSAEERSAWIEQQANGAVQNYLENWATRPLGPRGGEFSESGTRPLAGAPKAAEEPASSPRVRFTSPDGSTASLNMKGTPESVQRELEGLPEPDRTEALRALAASQGRPEPEGVPSPPLRDKRAEQYKSAYGGEEGKALFKERESLNILYATNAGMVNQLNMLENLYSNPNLPEGELGPILQRIRSGMQSVGIDVGDTTGPAGLANAIAQKMVLAQRTSDGTNLLPGAISNFEVQLLQSMGPTLSLTNEGRQALVRFMKEMAATNQRIAQEGTQFASQNNDMLTPGWYRRKERVMLEEMARLKMLSNQVMGQFKGGQK